MKLIFAETHYWESVPRVDGHHLAREISEAGHDTLYLSSPVSPIHFLNFDQWSAKWRRMWRYGGKGRLVEDRLRCVVPRNLIPVHATGWLDSPSLVTMSLTATFPRVDRLIRRLEFYPPDALIVQSLFFARLPGLLPGTPFLYRMTDDFSHFPGMPKALVECEGELVRGAELVTASSELLAERARSMGAARVEYLPHGVDFKRFKKPPTTPEMITSKPKAVYVGAIDKWFDARLVASAAKALPGWSFELAGPVGPAADLYPLREIENVRLVGPIPHEALPAYLHTARIGLIPFLRCPLVDAVHPIKLYEYLAAGLSVVSTRWDEIERIGAPIRLVNDSYEFTQAVYEEASQKPPSDGVEFSRSCDWSVRAQQLTKLIQEIRR